MGKEMVALFPKLTAILTVMALSACVAAGPGAKSGGKAAGPNPVTGAAIEVTALDDPGAKPAAAKPGTKIAKDPAVQAMAPVGSEAPAETGPKPKPRPETAPGADPAPPAPAAAPAEPQVEKTAAQLTCEKRGNFWSKAGKTGAYACVKRLGDGGKHCTTGKQCQGDCLARSNTCAPMTPLFGCNEILQDDGARVTLCLD